ncbi:hypothetical protein KR018_005086 [Drosophila ironensis]|nr:hypothetical protein KR018_005086 [Drosophila ironensis]
MPPKKRRAPRKPLNIEQKLELIETQEREQLTMRDLAERFGIGKSQASVIMQNKEAIRQGIKTGKMRRSQIRWNPLTEQGAHIDELCFNWFIRARSDGLAISGECVREKAREFAAQAGFPEFTASSGWLQKWQKRHNISYSPMDESLEQVDFEAVLVKSEPLAREDDFSGPEVVRPIYSCDEAMMQLSRLKEFVKDDFVSYQQLVSLENQLNWKWQGLKSEP